MIAVIAFMLIPQIHYTYKVIYRCYYFMSGQRALSRERGACIQVYL